MPAEKPWGAQILRIISDIERLDADARLGRAEVETIFGVGRTAADRIVTTAGGTTQSTSTGWAKTVSRQALLDYCRYSRDGQAALTEANRRAALARKLQGAEEDAKGRAVVIIPATDAERIRAAADTLLRDLPNVSIEPGELRILFRDAHDLTVQLWKLAMAMRNDWMLFEELTEPKKPNGDAGAPRENGEEGAA